MSLNWMITCSANDLSKLISWTNDEWTNDQMGHWLQYLMKFDLNTKLAFHDTVCEMVICIMSLFHSGINVLSSSLH